MYVLFLLELQFPVSQIISPVLLEHEGWFQVFQNKVIMILQEALRCQVCWACLRQMGTPFLSHVLLSFFFLSSKRVILPCHCHTKDATETATEEINNSSL